MLYRTLPQSPGCKLRYAAYALSCSISLAFFANRNGGPQLQVTVEWMPPPADQAKRLRRAVILANERGSAGLACT